MTSLQSKINAIIRQFPPLFSFAFAYGSAIFSQGATKEQKMIDFIFSVEDPLLFHKENMKMNYNHYSALKYAGPDLITETQEKLGAKVFFNTLVNIENMPVKYGVISTNHLIEDLLDWQTLYISGRLHKPVEVIKKPDKDLSKALITNFQSALHASLLCLPEVFSEEQLYQAIVRLSYNGDFRMYFGEDKKKIENIVKNQMPHFRKLYDEHLKLMPHLHWKQSQGLFEQDCSFETTLHHLNLLPKTVQDNILVQWCKDGRQRDVEDVLQALAHDTECSLIVERAVRDIVFWSSLTQSAKGILTAGLIKSLRYSSSKVKKMVKSIFKS